MRSFPPGPAQPESGGEIRPLTGIRGVAALLVAIYHAVPTERFGWAPLQSVMGHAYLAVDLFFILSGYVMALTYAQPFGAGVPPAAFARYLLRRVARIYPLYLALLAARLIGTLAVYGRLDGGAPGWAAVAVAHPLRDCLANLLLVQSWGLAPSINGPAWSVSTEFAAYFLFPLLVPLALFRSWRSAWSLAAGCGLMLGAAVWLDLRDGAYHSGMLDAYDGRSAAPLLRCLGGFGLGLLCVRLASWPAARRWAAHPLAGIVAITWLLGGLVAGWPDPAVYLGFPLLVLHLGVGSGPVAGILGQGWAVRLGMLSYAIYLLHVFLIGPMHQTEAWLRPVWPNLAVPVAAAGALLVLWLAAEAAHRLIEVPGRKLIRRIGEPGGEPAPGMRRANCTPVT